jgi:hypothetical protein
MGQTRSLEPDFQNTKDTYKMTVQHQPMLCTSEKTDTNTDTNNTMEILKTC